MQNNALSTSFLEVQFLDELCQKQSKVSVYLRNGVRLKGNLIAHDAEAVYIKAAGIIQMIYKYCASTIQPEIEFMEYP